MDNQIEKYIENIFLFIDLFYFFKLTMKEQKQKEDDKKVLTDHFIGTLPPLLNKVKAILHKVFFSLMNII